MGTVGGKKISVTNFENCATEIIHLPRHPAQQMASPDPTQVPTGGSIVSGSGSLETGGQMTTAQNR